jgi:catechol 2,3-dioxygenase-like lactoylglutathione lyase family enzyme
MARILALVLLAAGAAAAAQPPPAASRPRLTGIDHAAFRVSDVRSARSFYGEVLGLVELTPASPGRLVYRVGPRQRVMLEPGLPPPVAGNVDVSSENDERLSHIAFSTPDVKALGTYLSAHDVKVLQPADRCHPTAIRVQDPDGHTIEFVEAPWPPAHRPSRTPSRSVAMRPLSERLLHAGLIVTDEQRANQFYRDVLGFSEIWRGGRVTGVTDWVNMRVPDGTEYIEYMLGAPAPDRRRRGVLHHLCLVVPVIQDTWETAARRLDQAARSRLGPANIGTNGRWQLNLYDPDGTRVELMEPFTVR